MNTGKSNNTPLPFRSYQGRKPYIFISYSHFNIEPVYVELRRLHDLGYRIWYDEGKKQDTELPDLIADAIDECSFYIVFITSESARSRNVQKEVFYAVDKGKPFLSIYLEEASLSGKLLSKIGSLKALRKHGLSENSFFGTLNGVLPANLISSTQRRIRQEISDGINRGKKYLEKKNYEEAKSCFQSVLDLDPENAEPAAYINEIDEAKKAVKRREIPVGIDGQETRLSDSEEDFETKTFSEEIREDPENEKDTINVDNAKNKAEELFRSGEQSFIREIVKKSYIGNFSKTVPSVFHDDSGEGAYKLVKCYHCGLENKVLRDRPLDDEECDGCGESLQRQVPMELRELLFLCLNFLYACFCGGFVSINLSGSLYFGIGCGAFIGIAAAAIFYFSTEDTNRIAVLLGAIGLVTGSAIMTYFSGNSLSVIAAGGMVGMFLGVVFGYSPSKVLALFFCISGLLIGSTIGEAAGNISAGAVIGLLIGVGAALELSPAKLPIITITICLFSVAIGKGAGMLIGDAVGSPYTGGVVGVIAGTVPLIMVMPLRRFWGYALLCALGGLIGWIIDISSVSVIFGVLIGGIIGLFL